MNKAVLRTALFSVTAVPLLFVSPGVASAAVVSSADIIENDVVASVEGVDAAALCGATLLDQGTGTVVGDIAPAAPNDGWIGYSWPAVADGVYEVRHRCTVGDEVVFANSHRDLVAPNAIRPAFGSLGTGSGWVGEPGLIETLFGS
ncbi:hypothetical protein [Rhodococcus kronopolitis]|uniref:Uncharacterized protein n=1 Tax=Rhodococcus kronopolitis TaxID=1460226 RepID=A0ABV9FYK8_9NOCA